MADTTTNGGWSFSGFCKSCWDKVTGFFKSVFNFCNNAGWGWIVGFLVIAFGAHWLAHAVMPGGFLALLAVLVYTVALVMFITSIICKAYHFLADEGKKVGTISSAAVKAK